MFEYGATKMDQQQKQGGEMEQVYALNINMSRVTVKQQHYSATKLKLKLSSMQQTQFTQKETKIARLSAIQMPFL